MPHDEDPLGDYFPAGVPEEPAAEPDTGEDEYTDRVAAAATDFRSQLADAGLPVKPRKDRDPAADDAVPLFDTIGLDGLLAMPDPEWVIAGFLPAAGFGATVGPPKCGKTFLTLDVILHIAAGLRWQGRVTKCGKVLYQAAEGMAGLKLRVEAWLLAHPEADVNVIRENLIIIPRPVRVLEMADAVRFIRTVEHHKPLVSVLDTWARAMLGGDENAALDVGRAIATVEEARDRSGSAVMVIHHSNADGTRERGSTALRGAVEFLINCKTGESSGLEVSCGAMKDAKPFSEMTFDLREVGRSVVLTSEPLNQWRQDAHGPAGWQPPAPQPRTYKPLPPAPAAPSRPGQGWGGGGASAVRFDPSDQF